MAAFEDVDFTKDPKYVQGYAANVVLKATDKLKTFKDGGRPVYTIDQCRTLAKKIQDRGGGNQRLITRVTDQGQEGSCTSHGATNNMQICQARQVGKKNVIQLSPMSLYKQIGSGPNSGSSPDDAIEVLSTIGQLPLDNEQNRKLFAGQTFPERGFSNRYPDGWKTTAAKFIATESFIADTFEEFISALVQGYGVTYGRQGHCICAVDYVFVNGVWRIKYLNSWGEWGDAGGDFSYGFGYDSESLVRNNDWGFVITQVKTPQLSLAA